MSTTTFSDIMPSSRSTPTSTSWHPNSPPPPTANSPAADFHRLHGQDDIHSRDSEGQRVDMTISENPDYLWDGKGDIDAESFSVVKDDVGADANMTMPAQRREREQRMLGRSARQQVTCPQTTITTSTTRPRLSYGYHEEEIFQRLGTLECSASTQKCGDRSTYLLPRTNTFWDAELAAQRELDNDDYAWYYRNPHRYIRRPRNHTTRLRAGTRRRKTVREAAMVEEGMWPNTNLALFAAYISRHYSHMRIGGGAEDSGKEERSWNVGSEARQADDLERPYDVQHPVGSGSVDDYCGSSVLSPEMADWQEELFSPTEHHGHHFRRTSCSSSIESYTSGYSSAALSSEWLDVNPMSTQSSPAIDMDLQASRGHKARSSRACGVGFTKISFLRVQVTPT